MARPNPIALRNLHRLSGTSAPFVARERELAKLDRFLETASALVERTDERFFEPELYRLKGVTLPEGH